MSCGTRASPSVVRRSAEQSAEAGSSHLVVRRLSQAQPCHAPGGGVGDLTSRAPFAVVGTLARSDPRADRSSHRSSRDAWDEVRDRGARRRLQQSVETLLPPGGQWRPTPSRVSSGEAAFRGRASRMPSGCWRMLLGGPPTEPVATDRVGRRGTQASPWYFDVCPGAAETVLPLVGVWVPGPARQVLKSVVLRSA